MSINVDPFLITWPRSWINDPEIAPVIGFLDQYFRDLRERTGGDDDLVSSTSDEVNSQGGSVSTNTTNIANNASNITENSDDILFLISQISALNAKIALLAKKVEHNEDLIWLRT